MNSASTPLLPLQYSGESGRTDTSWIVGSGGVDRGSQTSGDAGTSSITRNTTSFAKGIAGTMVGLALLAVVSLALMALRLRRRGGTGRKTGAWIRSLGPIVFGLGGWFLGALFAMTLWPSVSLDDQASDESGHPNLKIRPDRPP